MRRTVLHSLLGLAVLCGATLFAHAATPVMPDAAAAPVSAPGADVLPGLRLPPGPMRMPPGAPVRHLRPAATGTAGAEAMAARNRRSFAGAGRWRGQPLAIGYPRDVDAAIPLRDLAWATMADGGRAARIELTSPGARALRVALTLDGARDGITVRVASAGANEAMASLAAGEIAQAARRDGALWSPLLDGDRAVVEIEARAGVDIADVTLGIPRLAHLVVGSADLRAPEAALMRASGIGAAAACNVDAACAIRSDVALQTLARSVARIAFVAQDGFSYLCSATLLNDTARTNTPYLFTADHCIDSLAVARSIVSFWLFTATSCDSHGTPPYLQLTGGGTLLGRSQDDDWSLVRLEATPPAGTRLASWRAEPIAAGTAVVALHHPRGDLLKASHGTVTGALQVQDDLVDGSFTEVTWAAGITEGGSSGGLLATADGGVYEVRGGLYGGLSSCIRPSEPDYFSRLETMLPLMRDYLTPSAGNPGGELVVVEFHHAALDRYFLATDPAEIASLDSGRTAGWERTGLRFLAYRAKVEGANAVCRLYRLPPRGDAHFYSASRSECAAALADPRAGWIQESAAAFYLPLPDPSSGACPAGTMPVYRYFNRATGGHRYTTQRVTSLEMRRSSAWIAEGYGPGPLHAAMCAVEPGAIHEPPT